MRALLATILLLCACGDEHSGGPVDAAVPVADAIPAARRFLPLAQGATWTWRVTPTAGVAFDKTSTVEAYERVGADGPMAYRVRTTGDDGVTVSWQVDTGAAVQRVREESYTLAQVLLTTQDYVPYKLRLDERDERLALGASYTETYSELETDPVTHQTTTTAKSETWTVEALDEQVTVPAGTFACLRVHRVGNEAGASDKRFWFARGVGKVKEDGKQVEELAVYSLP